MNALQQEALWAIKTLAQQGKISERDSALMFVSWNALDYYLNELHQIWQAFPKVHHAIAIKSQPHPSILKQLVNRGFGLEAATWEEVQLALQAGCEPSKIVFDSPVKRQWEIQNLAQNAKGILLNANSIEELKRILPFSDSLQIGLRINPLVETNAPEAYQVSKGDSKFGVSISQRSDILNAIVEFPIEVLHVHASSSMTDVVPAVQAIKQMVELADEANELLKQKGIARQIKKLDLGGGLMPEAPDTQATLMNQYVQLLASEMHSLLTDFELVTEFGQWVHYFTGYAYSDVEYVKKSEHSQMIYVHLGADFLLRDVYLKPRKLQWLPLRNYEVLKGDELPTSIAGPLCFAKDFLNHNILLPKLNEGDGIMMLHTGSNAYALWSRHTSRTIPAMYGVDYQNKKIEQISERFNPYL